MRLRLLVALLVITSSVRGYHYSGHSFFSIRTPFQSASPEKEALWHYDVLDRNEPGHACSFEVVPFGGRSIGRELGHFFGPLGKSTLEVEEFKPSVDASTEDHANGRKDLEARHFNIETRSRTSTFHSRLRLRPHHSFVGAGFAYRQRLWSCWWMEVSAPVMRVENRVELNETDIRRAGGPVNKKGLDGRQRFGTVTEAFRSGAIKFARIDGRDHRKVGVADVEVKLGWDGFNDGQAHFRSYIGGVFPTGNKPDPRLLFPPVVGNNKHFGVMVGGNIGFDLCSFGNHLFRHEIDTNGRFLFPNHQVRSFDLKDKQWSRYMEVYESKDQARRAFESDDPNSGSFGVNFFTRKVKVEPRFATTFNTAFIYEYCENVTAEVGYNFYARQGERIHFDGFNRRAALKHVEGKGKTTLSRTIRDNFKGDFIPFKRFTPIDISDLDKCSGSHPPVISQIFYGAVGYRADGLWCPTTWSIGGSYEFSHSNGGLRRWMVWGKASVDF